jgi:hypothetical protein
MIPAVSTTLALEAAVEEFRAVGAEVLEYDRTTPGVHASWSWHYRRANGHALAADVNWPGPGELAVIESVLFPIAQRHGLAVTCGLRGNVPNHSGSMLHLHVDPGPYSNLGDSHGAAVRESWTGRPQSAPLHVGELAEDGVLGIETMVKWAQLMGTLADGVFSYPRSALIEATQRATGATVDGKGGPDTWTHLQRHLGVTADGIPGHDTIARLQRRINAGKL